MKNYVFVGSLLAALAVIIGAFGAHALKPLLSEYELGIFSTGSDYHFYHALALVAYGLFSRGRKTPAWPAWAFVIGIVLFSGSLYAIAILHNSKLGMITPLGGVAFIAGWVGFAISAKKEKL